MACRRSWDRLGPGAVTGRCSLNETAASARIRGAFDRVTQLTDVARPPRRRAGAHALRADAGRWAANGFTDFREKRIGQLQHHVESRSRKAASDLRRRRAGSRVSRKLTALAWRHAGRGWSRQSRGYRRGSRECCRGAELAFLEDAEQLGLDRRRHRRQLHRKQHAARGLLRDASRLVDTAPVNAPRSCQTVGLE